MVKSMENVKKAVPAKTAAPAAKANVKKTVPAQKTKTAAKSVAAKKTPVAAKPAAAAQKVAPAEKPHKKLKLTKKQQQHYMELLMEARSRFMNQLRFHQDEALTSKKDSAGERAGMATHMADLGSDNFRHDLELGLMTEEGDVLEMIDEALQKISESEYGICAECGCAINPERLEAKPYARFCVRCKSRLEELEDPVRRHR